MTTFVPSSPITRTFTSATSVLSTCKRLPRRCAFVGAIALVATGAFRARSQLFDFRNRSTTQIATMSTGRSTQTTLLGGGEGVVVDAPNGTASAAVVFLHGLGDTCAGWSPMFPLLPHVMTVLPTANTIPVSLNMGMSMPSWFDLHGLDMNAKDDKPGILAAVHRVERIIDALPVPSERVVVAGFSQGGAIALTAALRTSRKLAGVAFLSSWLPLRDEYPNALSSALEGRGMEAFMAHGAADMVVATQFGEMSAQKMVSLGIKVEKHIYTNMGHSACDKEMEDLKAFLSRVLPEYTK